MTSITDIKYNPTKIICTAGPATSDETVLEEMLRAGMDLTRLNFSHGTHDDHRQTFEMLGRAARRLGCHPGILADLQGPKIRTGKMEGGNPVELAAGEQVTITTENQPGTAACVSTTYTALPGDVETGDRLLLDDGLLELQVQRVQGQRVVCEIITGGPLGDHKGINLPGVKISSPSFTDKDKRDVAFALQLGVDYIALSFVRRAKDVIALREYIQALGYHVPIVAKIEKPEALDQLTEVIAASDVIMVARGDLGVELSPEMVPVWQKRIINECAVQGKPVITATQMLESMRENPRPTRAEASDVANAIFDGTDAVMLSGETAVGKYPVESVAMMRRIATEAEREQSRWQQADLFHHPRALLPSVAAAVSRAAVTMACEVGARAIVAYTESGSTALIASKQRPRMPILAFTPLEATARRTSLYWGVRPVVVETVDDTDQMIRQTNAQIKELGLVASGESIVLTAGVPMGSPGSTNMVRVETIS
jgi:pyruvate kinase